MAGFFPIESQASIIEHDSNDLENFELDCLSMEAIDAQLRGNLWPKGLYDWTEKQKK